MGNSVSASSWVFGAHADEVHRLLTAHDADQSVARQAGLSRATQLLHLHPHLLTRRPGGEGATLWHDTAAGGSPEAMSVLVAFMRSPSSPYAHLDPQLLDAKVRQFLDLPDLQRQTPLHYACAHGQAAQARHLMSLGADPYCRDRHGLTAVHVAAREGHAACIFAILDSVTPQQEAEFCQLHGYFVFRRPHDVVSTSGLTPLHFAVARNHPACVQTLLDFDAKLTIKSKVFSTETGVILPASSTPLHVAAKSALAELVRMMLRHMAARGTAYHSLIRDLRQSPDANGHTPYLVACRSLDPRMLWMLDPHSEVMDLFSLQELATSVTGVPKLSILAAAKLQGALLSTLDALVPPTASSSMTPTTTSTAPPGPASSSRRQRRPSLPGGANIFITASWPTAGTVQAPVVAEDAPTLSAMSCRLDVVQGGELRGGVGGGSRGPRRRAARAAVERRDSLEGMCMLCMEREHDASVAVCGHAMCQACARQLCTRVVDKPPACPFCRRFIGAFTKASSPAAAAAAEEQAEA